MKIQCQNCGVEHEIAPPSWVVSSGRAFRFRCSSCGYSQSVHPSTLSEEPTGEPPDLGAPTPSFPPPTPTPIEERSAQDRPLGGSGDDDTEPELIEEEEDDPSLEVPDDPFDHDPLSSMDDATPSSGSGASAVFLKQNGQIYMVSDWDTLKRWIAESRVERHDLVSEGGVRWEPVGNRPELMSAFGGAAPAASPFPFGGETPFGNEGGGNLGWHDDDTEGVPTGLPPLPTDEIPPADARGFDALDARLRKMTPTPPPVARRAPPPARPSFLTPTPAPAHRMNPDDVETAQPEPRAYAPPPPEAPQIDIAPPALPDTVPPAPVRKPPAPALLPEDDPDITQKRVVLDAAMRPKAYQMADEDTVKTQPIVDDEISGIHELPPLPAQPTYLEPDEHLDDEFVIKRTSPAFYLAAAGLLPLLFLACFGAFYVVSGNPQRPPPEPIPSLPRPAPVEAPVLPAPSEPAPTEPEPGEPAPTQPIAPVPGEPAPTEPSAPDATPAPTAPVPAPAQPAPTPVPPPPQPVAPAPVRPAPPPRPAPASVNALIDAGWNQVDGNPAGAAAKFRQAVDASPGNADANFGYGYALIKQGKKDQARSYLCKAAATGSVDTKREARGTLTAAGLDCGG